MAIVTQTVSICVGTANQATLRYQDSLQNDAQTSINLPNGAAGNVAFNSLANKPGGCSTFNVSISYSRSSNTVSGTITSTGNCPGYSTPAATPYSVNLSAPC